MLPDSDVGHKELSSCIPFLPLPCKYSWTQLSKGKQRQIVRQATGSKLFMMQKYVFNKWKIVI